MQIYIINKHYLDENADEREQQKAIKELVNAILKTKAKKQKLDCFLIKRSEITDHIFTYSHSFNGILFFNYGGVIS